MKSLLVLLVVCAASFILAFEPKALDAEEIENELRSAVPEQARELVGDIDLEGGGGRYGFDFFLSAAKNILSEISGKSLENISVLCVFTVTSALFETLSESAGSEQLKSVYRFTAALCLAGASYGVLYGMAEAAEYSIGVIGSFSNALLPVMTLLYGSGGNVGSAAVSAAASALALDGVELICTHLIYPVFNISFCFALAGCCGADSGVCRVGAFVRKSAAALISAAMSLFCAILIYQNDIARSADGVAMRSFRFAASRYVPIVGGAVSEAASVLGGSLGYIKSGVGSAAVAVIFAVAAPPIISLALYSFGFGLAAAVADLLGLGGMSGFLNGMKGTVGYLIALLVSCASVFTVIFALLIRSTDLLA